MKKLTTELEELEKEAAKFEGIAAAQCYECMNCGKDISSVVYFQEGQAVFCYPCYKYELWQRYGIR